MLSLEGKLSDISFCDKKCSNVNNNDFKEEFIRFIDDKYNIKVVDKLYVFLNILIQHDPLNFVLRNLMIVYDVEISKSTTNRCYFPQMILKTPQRIVLKRY